MSREPELIAAEKMRERAAQVCDEAAARADHRSPAEAQAGVRPPQKVRALWRAARQIRALPARHAQTEEGEA